MVKQTYQQTHPYKTRTIHIVPWSDARFSSLIQMTMNANRNANANAKFNIHILSLESLMCVFVVLADFFSFFFKVIRLLLPSRTKNQICD